MVDQVPIFTEPYDRNRLQVLLKLDPSSVREFNEGAARSKRADNDYALAWTHAHGKGRVFFTALGHQNETWLDPHFHQLLLGAIGHVAGVDDVGLKLSAPLTGNGAVPVDSFQEFGGQPVALFNGKDLSGWYYTNRHFDKELTANGGKELLDGKSET